MTKKRLFFFDIDHTLYNNEKKIIPPQTQKLLHQLSQNRNNVLGIATGRSQSGLRVLQELKKLFRYFIVFNGAITFEKEKIIQKQVIPLQDVLKINQKALEAGNQIFNFSLEKKNNLFQIDADSKEFMINEECGQQPSLNEPIYKINLFHHDVQRVVNFLKEFSQFNAYFWKSGAVSLSAKVVSKAYGIAPIQKLYPDHQLICVGDGCNDEEMFRAANLSILMENTKYDYLKKIAKLIAPDIQNDRLFDFFQKHDLIY